VIFARALAMAVDAHGGETSSATVVIVVLIGISLLLPVALLVWDHARGVHVYEEGIKSVGANSSVFIAWPAIKAFEIGPRPFGTLAVFAVRSDGTREPLGDTTRWPYQRKSVERVRDELERYLGQSRDRAASAIIHH
jgi:hypothetical protein